MEEQMVLEPPEVAQQTMFSNNQLPVPRVPRRLELHLVEGMALQLGFLS